ncbi:hypothetical protein RGQ29_019018 [Quercus rubra]|uniref:DUF4220 domain-containing protein n=1 Tax=Quercus rubra TaxID=3512 RepID=A0AAN7ISH5_QUERU|nr:hypothetical protein RGQ29_019018 [Quercus rubra]
MLLTVFNSWAFLETRRLIQVFPEPVRKLWNNWELRVLVLVSLTLQLSLLHLGSRRRYCVKTWLRVFLWFSYLGADSVATVALGVISNNQGCSCDCNDSLLHNDLAAFWAPFLLLHLGGQDTITAYAVQDNELWLRHLLGLLVQFSVALYIFLLSWKANWLSFLSIPMLLIGFIKYAERTWAMRSANYAPCPSRPERHDSHENHDEPVETYLAFHYMKRFLVFGDDINHNRERIQDDAFQLFKDFRCLFLNQRVIMLYRMLFDDDSIFVDSQTTWKVIEVELGYAYDVYYTKAPLFFTAWGFIFRFFSFTSTLLVFVLFFLKESHKHPQMDLIITYLLLVGAILIEIYGVILLSASDWPWPDHDGLVKHLQTLFAPIRKRCAKLTSKQRWSNSIAQLNLLNLCLKDKSDQVGQGSPKLFANSSEWVFNQILPRPNGELELHLCRTHKQVSADLKDMVYSTFRQKFSSNSEGFSEDYDNYVSYGSLNVEIYQRIIIWHIATDNLCFYTDNGAYESTNNLLEVSKDISDYMMYILVMCPFVLSTGNAILSFENTCSSVEGFFLEKNLPRLPKANSCARLISEYVASINEVDVYLLKDSLLSLAVLLANKLSQMDGKWEILSKFWVENLAYVATLCQGNNHAQLLRKGGEFLTHVWLLIEHFHLTRSFQKSRTRPQEE